MPRYIQVWDEETQKFYAIPHIMGGLDTQTVGRTLATLNGKVAQGTIIDTTNGWTVNATNVLVDDGDIVEIRRGGWAQRFSVQVQAAGALKVVPQEALPANTAYPDKTPIWLVVAKQAA